MKKILFGVAALGLLGLAGAGLGLKAQDTVEAKAATETTIFCAISASKLGSYTLKANVAREWGWQDDGNKPFNYQQYDMSNTGKTYGLSEDLVFSCTFTDLYNGAGQIQFQLYDEDWVEQVVAFSGWHSAGDYNHKIYTYSSGDNGEWAAYEETCTVTFDENGDGTGDKEVEVLKGATVDSYTPFSFGNTFVAWKLEEANFDFDTPITEDITLEASWTTRADEKSYIYVVTGYGANWNTRYIYGYGATEGYGAFEGQLVKDIAVGVTSTVNFGGGSNEYKNGGIFKVPYYTDDSMTHIILSNNGSESDRSGNLPFGDGYGYFFKNNAWDDDADDFDEANIASVGKAAAFVYEFDELLSGKDFCTELDASGCASLYNKYLAAIKDDDTAKGWIESSVINTSNGGDNVRLDVILPELRKIAVRGDQKVNDVLKVNASEISNDVSAAWIAVIAAVGLATIGGAFIVRKRRAE